MATFGFRTARDLSAFVGCWIVFTNGQRCALNTAPGTPSEGVIVRVDTLGGTQWAQIDSGVNLRKIVAGAAYAAGVPITNDANGRTVPAGVDDVVTGVAIDASTGAGEFHFIQPLSAAAPPSFLFPTQVNLSGQENHFVLPDPGGLLLSPAGPAFAILLSIETLAGPIQYGRFVAVIATPTLIVAGAAFGAGVPIESDALGRAVAAAPGPLLGGGILSRQAATAPGELVWCEMAFKP